MAVIQVKTLSATGGETASGPSYNLKIWVRTDSRDDGPKTVQDATGWQYGDPYEYGNDYDSRARASSIKANQVDDSNFYDWFVDVDFGVIKGRDKDNSTNPLADPVEESWGFTQRAQDVAIDLDGKPYVNTAGEIIEHQRQANFPIVTFIRNEISVNQSAFLALRDAVNSAAWKGFAAKTVKVQSITADLQFNKTATLSGKYWRVSYNFEVDPDTWRFRPLNAGLNQRAVDPLDGLTKLMPIYFSDGTIADRPVPLNMAGASLRNGAGTLTGMPFLLDFVDYPEVPFATVFAGL